MSTLSDDELNRMRWAARRGMLELDLVLEPFVTARYEKLDAADRARFQRLMRCEDQDLFAWFCDARNRKTRSWPALSTRYSTSHELHLQIARSRLRPTLVASYYGCHLWAIFLLLRNGHPYPGLLLSAACLVLLLSGRRSAEISGLCWRGGRWWLIRPEGRVAAEIDSFAGCPPWFFTIRWRGAGEERRSRVWLFRDQLPEADWRRLLARLKLSGEIVGR